MIGKPMMLMNKEEKIRALDYLDQKGVFKITKTSLLLCDAMQISKYTLYNYLEEARIHERVKRMNKNHKLILSTSVCLSMSLKHIS